MWSGVSYFLLAGFTEDDTTEPDDQCRSEGRLYHVQRESRPIQAETNQQLSVAEWR